MWTAKRALHTARSHPAAVSYKGRIYVFGGGGPNFLSLDTVEVYNPRNDQWSWGAPMPTHRSGAVAEVVNDRIYVLGGGYKKPDGKFRFLTTVEIYDPGKDRWEEGPDMLQPHDYPGVAVSGRHIYIMGGHHPDATEGGPSKDPGFTFCEVLDVSKGVWAEIAPLPVPRFALKGAVLNMNNPSIFNNPPLSPFSKGGLRGIGAEVGVSAEKVLATGGVAFTGQGLTEYDRIDIYDPDRDAWTQEEGLSLPWPAAAHGVCIHQGGLYIFGGYSTEGIHTRAACYDPGTKAWRMLSPIDKPRAAMGVVSIEETIYLVGGWEVDGRTVMDTVIAYLPG